MPLSDGLPFGIRISGLSLKGIVAPEIRREMLAAFERHGLIEFENIAPTNEMQVLEEACQAINALAKSLSYHHLWKPTEMVIWDNGRMLHSVSGNRPEDERLMYRTTIKGDYGLGRFESTPADQ